jgi:hypothetical protein
VLLEFEERAEWMPGATAALVARFAICRAFRIAVAGPAFAELTADDRRRLGYFGEAMSWRAERHGEHTPSKAPHATVSPRVRPTAPARPRERRERRHVARATSSADGGDDGPGEPAPAPAGADA